MSQHATRITKIAISPLADRRVLPTPAAAAAGAVADLTADPDILRVFSSCLDRPAFQDEFRSEGHLGDFDQAGEDTITAINTGCLRDRRGAVLATCKGKSHLTRHDWRRRMALVVDLLRAIRSRFIEAVRTGEIRVRPDGFHEVRNRQVGR